MKRFILVVISCIFVVVLTGWYSFAQMDSGMKGEMKQQGMKMDEGMMKQMMEKCQPMMKQMMGDGMMKKEMMQMMMEMMNMQEKMMKGAKAAEKKQMMKDMAQMKGKMQKMMSMHMDMTGMDDSQSKLKCAEQWLKKAIDLHELRMKDHTTLPCNLILQEIADGHVEVTVIDPLASHAGRRKSLVKGDCYRNQL